MRRRNDRLQGKAVLECASHPPVFTFSPMTRTHPVTCAKTGLTDVTGDSGESNSIYIVADMNIEGIGSS